MNPNIKAKEVIAAFQRYLSRNDKSEIEAYSLEELQSADEQLGQRDQNASFRIALNNRIRELEGHEVDKKASHRRAVNYVVTFCLGVLATLAAQWLM